MQDKQRDEVPPKVEEKVAKEIEVLPAAAKAHQTSVDSEVCKTGDTDPTHAKPITVLESRSSD